jgi:hypothetical protein
MISYNDWIAKQIEESSAFTRLRQDAANGLKPPIPDAEIDSHSTAPPWQVPKLKGKGHKKKHKHKHK